MVLIIIIQLIFFFGLFSIFFLVFTYFSGRTPAASSTGIVVLLRLRLGMRGTSRRRDIERTESPPVVVGVGGVVGIGIGIAVYLGVNMALRGNVRKVLRTTAIGFAIDVQREMGRGRLTALKMMNWLRTIRWMRMRVGAGVWVVSGMQMRKWVGIRMKRTGAMWLWLLLLSCGRWCMTLSLSLSFTVVVVVLVMDLRMSL